VNRQLVNELGLEESEELGRWEERYVVGQVDVAYTGPELATPRRAAAALPASERDRPRPDPTPFRLGAGHGTLGRIDVGRCRDLGLPSGYVRMRVTFRQNGHVVHAAVQSDAPPTREALACIGNQLTAAVVPAFDGQDVTLSRIVYVAGLEAESGTEESDVYLQRTR
jgi:hypothetical protein